VFRKCYEGDNPERFKPYFATNPSAELGPDIWKYSQFEELLNSDDPSLHFLWAKRLHRPDAIKTITKKPKWMTKPDHEKAQEALYPELIDFFERIGQVPEFQIIQSDAAWNAYGSLAISNITWLRNESKTKFPDLMKRIELRTFGAIFDLCIQQGGFGSPLIPDSNARPNIKAKIAANTFTSQRDLVKMAVLERAGKASASSRNDCASRRLGFLNAQATPSTIFGTPGKTRANIHYHLLEPNPYIHGL
jgi:hypothetical protein